MELEGSVERQLVARGSKAEHDAIVLRTRLRVYWLRRRGGHPYRDRRLEILVGHRLRVSGSVAGPWFIVDRWEFLDEDMAKEQKKTSAKRKKPAATAGTTKRGS